MAGNLTGGIARSHALEEVNIVWWADLLWGFWNGLTAWIVLVVHIFGGWEQFPFYNEARSGNWYDFGSCSALAPPSWVRWAGGAGGARWPYSSYPGIRAGCLSSAEARPVE